MDEYTLLLAMCIGLLSCVAGGVAMYYWQKIRQEPTPAPLPVVVAVTSAPPAGTSPPFTGMPLVTQTPMPKTRPPLRTRRPIPARA